MQQHRSRSRVLVSGPRAVYADGFGLALARRGYRPSSIEGQLRLMAHPSCLLRARGLAAKMDVTDLDAGELTDAQLGGDGELKHRVVTSSGPSGGLTRIDP